MAKTVRNLLGPPLKMIGLVTRADGGKTGIGRGYGGARIELENLTTTDPHSRQLVAAQIIWTLARADIKGPYVINADGAALDDRFADGWNTTDLAATDPGAVDGASAGVHALLGGVMVSLDGQRATPVPGSFGAMGDQAAAALSRTGRDIASVVTLRRGAPDMASSLWIGPNGGVAAQVTDARSLTRPSWALDDAVWVVVDGNSVVRVIQEEASGQPARIPVDSAAVTSKFPGAITELQLSRDGTRAAMVINGQVVLAEIEQTPVGEFAMTYPRRLGFGLGSSVVSLSWRTGDDMVVTRNRSRPSGVLCQPRRRELRRARGNLVIPVSSVAANPSAVYVSDARGVLQLSGTTARTANPGRMYGLSWCPARCRCCPADKEPRVSGPVLPGVIRQIGYIVRDFDQALDKWVQLGVGPWYVLRGITQSGLYRGEPCTVTLTIGFANSGDLQIEVIHQDDDTPSIYNEFTSAGGDGFHQLAYWADDYEAALAAGQAAGWPVVWSGGDPDSARYAYFEPRPGRRRSSN